MKKQEAEKAKLKQIPMKPINKHEVKQGKGSVWNNNSYHWEQKSVDKWSEETLKKVINDFKYQLKNA